MSATAGRQHTRGTHLAMRAVLLVVVIAALVGALFSAPAQARKVAGATPVNFTLTGGVIRIDVGNPADPSSTPFPLTSIGSPVLPGTVASDGSILIRKQDININEFTISLDVDLDSNPATPPLTLPLKLKLDATDNWTGTYNANTGKVDLRAAFEIAADATILQCKIGPVVVNGTTATKQSEAATGGRAREMTGKPVAPDGTFSIVDNLAVIPVLPAQSNPPNVNDRCPGSGLLNPILGLTGPAPGYTPIPDVRHEITFDLKASPLPQPGVQPRFSIAPNASDPQKATFDASGSTVPGGATKYEWSFDGGQNWTSSGTNSTPEFSRPAGSYSVRLRITDGDGDSNTSTVQTWVVRSAADLKLDLIEPSQFRTNHQAQLTARVTNDGDFDADTSNSKPTVYIDLPSGTSFASYLAPAVWSCSPPASGSRRVTCNYTLNKLEAKQSSDIQINVRPSSGSAGPARFDGAVDWSLESSTTHGNDADDLLVSVSNTSPSSDLAVSYLFPSHYGFLESVFVHGWNPTQRAGTVGNPGKGVFMVGIANVGSNTLNSSLKVKLKLPAGVTVDTTNTQHWPTSLFKFSCTQAAQGSGTQATCTTTDPDFRPDESYPAEIPVNLDSTVGTYIDVSSEVELSGDSTVENNTRAIHTAVRPSIELKATGPASAKVGDTVTYTVKPSNTTPIATASGEQTVIRIPKQSGFMLKGLPRNVAGNYNQQWSCGESASEVTCSTTDPIGGNQSARPIEFDFEVGSAAYSGPNGQNEFTIAPKATSTLDPSADGDAVSTDVKAVDLAVNLTAPDSVTEATTASYDLGVENVGTTDSSSTTSVNLDLPVGTTYEGSSGSAWTCSGTNDVTCETSSVIGAGSAAPALKLDLKTTHAGTASIGFSAVNSADAYLANNDGRLEVTVKAKPDDKNPDPVDPACKATNTCEQAPSGDDVVSNPGDKTLEVLGGSLNLKGKPVELPAGMQFGGSVDKDGNVSLPSSQMALPPIPYTIKQEDSPIGQPIPLKITLKPVGDFTGTIDPSQRSVKIGMRFVFQIEALGATCAVGSEAAPVSLTMNGNNYEPSDGTVRLEAGTALPEVTGAGLCAAFASAAKSQLGIGDPGVTHTVIFNSRFNPAITTNRKVIDKPVEPVVVTKSVKPGVAAISSKNRKLTVKKGKATVKLACTGSTGAACEGRFVVNGKFKARGKKAKAVKYTKTFAYKFKVGETPSITLKLTSKASAALLSSKQATLNFNLTPTGQAKASSSGKLKLLAAKSKRKRH